MSWDPVSSPCWWLYLLLCVCFFVTVSFLPLYVYVNRCERRSVCVHVPHVCNKSPQCDGLKPCVPSESLWRDKSRGLGKLHTLTPAYTHTQAVIPPYLLCGFLLCCMLYTPGSLQQLSSPRFLCLPSPPSPHFPFTLSVSLVCSHRFTEAKRQNGLLMEWKGRWFQKHHTEH